MGVMYYDIFLGIRRYSSHCYRSTENDYKSGAFNDNEKNWEKKQNGIYCKKLFKL